MSASAAPTATGSAPRWGVQSSLIQPRQPAFWLFVVLLAIGGYLFLDEQLIFSQLPTAFATSWGLVLLYAVPVFLIVYRLDLFEREPRLMLVGALLWGGVIAVSLAGYANDAWLSVLGKVAPASFTSDWGAAVVAPFTEEILKLAGVIVLFLIVPAEIDGVMDGFVYGALIGLGFTVTEDVSYFIQATVSFGGADQTGPVIDTFLIRVVAGGLYSHVLFAGLTGMGFAYFVTQRGQTFNKRLGVFGLLVAAGVAAHFIWDSPWMISVLESAGGAKPSTMQWAEYGALKGLPFFALLVTMVLLATRSEEKSFRAIVAGEPDPEVIYEPEVVSLGSLWSRRSARSTAARTRGPEGARLTGQLQKAQIEYAMIRSESPSPSDPRLDAQRMKIRQIRAQLGGVQWTPAQPVAASMPSSAPVAGQAWQAPPQPAMPAPQPVPAALESRPTSELAPAQPIAQPSAAPRPQTPAWVPTHLVPPGGMQAWAAPDPSQPPITNLPERLELIVENQAGVWVMVRAVNGWRGWVDGRRLMPRS